MRKLDFIEYVALTLCVTFIGVFVVAAISTIFVPSLADFYATGVTRLEARELYNEALKVYTIIAKILLWTSFGCAAILLGCLVMDEINRILNNRTSVSYKKVSK